MPEIKVEKYLGLMKSRAASFHKTTGIEFEELLSTAYCAFPVARNTYDPARGAFSTHLWNCCESELLNYCAANRRWIREGEDPIPDWAGQTKQHVDFKDALVSLSSEAQEVCRMIFTSPQEFLILNKPKLSRGKLKDALRDANWSWPKIWACFREIKSALSQMG